MTSHTQKTHYDILECHPQSTAKEIRQAYLRQSLRHHPDKNPTDVENAQRRFVEIGRAYDTLKDPETRAAYDRELSRGGGGFFANATTHDDGKSYDNYMDQFDRHMAGLSPDDLDQLESTAMMVGGIIGSFLGSRMGPKGNGLAGQMGRMAGSLVGSAMGSKVATSAVRAVHETSLERVKEDTHQGQEQVKTDRFSSLANKFQKHFDGGSSAGRIFGSSSSQQQTSGASSDPNSGTSSQPQSSGNNHPATGTAGANTASGTWEQTWGQNSRQQQGGRQSSVLDGLQQAAGLFGAAMAAKQAMGGNSSQQQRSSSNGTATSSSSSRRDFSQQQQQSQKFMSGLQQAAGIFGAAVGGHQQQPSANNTNESRRREGGVSSSPPHPAESPSYRNDAYRDASAPPSYSILPSGSIVRLTGLRNRPDLNNRSGVVLSYDGSVRRYVVQLYADVGCDSATYQFHPDNISLIDVS